MSDERIKAPTTSDNSLAPALSYFGNKTRVKIDGKTVYIYIYIYIYIYMVVNPPINTLPLLNFFLQLAPLLKSEEVYERLPFLDAPF